MWCLHGIYVCVQYVSLLGVCKHYVFVAPACVCVQTADHVYVLTCLHRIQYKSVSVHRAHRQWRQGVCTVFSINLCLYTGHTDSGGRVSAQYSV